MVQWRKRRKGVDGEWYSSDLLYLERVLYVFPSAEVALVLFGVEIQGIYWSEVFCVLGAA